MSEAYGKKEEELHQLLTIYKESWRDDHKFFSTKDLAGCRWSVRREV